MRRRFFYLKVKTAMTLVEILIVTALISIVSVALYHGLVNGLKVWQYSQRLVVEENISIFFEKLSKELRNTVVFSKLPFYGESNVFSFPTIIQINSSIDSSNDKDFQSTLGKVEYGYDVTKKGIYRREADYGQALTSAWSEPQIIVSGIDSLHFGYIYNTDNQEVVSENVLTTTPSAVEVKIKFTENNQQREIVRVIDIPLGQ